MGRFIKWALSIIVGIIIIAGIAVFIFLSTMDFNNYKPAISKAAYDATGRELTIGGDIDLKIGLSPSMVMSGVKFQNAPWGSRPEMVNLERLEVQVALLPLLGRDIEIKRFILIEPDILIETDKTGKLNTVFKKSEKSPAEDADEKTQETEDLELPSLTFNNLEIKNGKLVYRDGQTGKSEQIILKTLTASAKGINSPMNLDLKGTYNDASFNLKGQTGPLAQLTDQDKDCPVDITLEAFDAIVSLKGSVRDVLTPKGIDLGFDLSIDDWDGLSGLAGQPIPLKEALNISGKVNDSGSKSYTIRDLKIRLGESEITGTMGLNMARSVPGVEVSLASKNLDLRPLMSKEGKNDSSASSTDSPKAKDNRLFPDDPLPVDAMKKVNAKINIRFDKVILPQLAVSNLETNITLNSGRLDINPLKANAGGGTLNGTVNIKPSGNALDVSARLSCLDIDAGNTLKEAGITDLLEGIIDLEVDIAGKGASVASVMAGLNGYTSVIMGGGRIGNKYIDIIGGGIGESIFRLINPTKEKKDYTAINCMVTRLDMTNGEADVTALVLDTEVMSVIGEGDIDLGTERLNLSLNPVPKEGVGGYTLNLGELAKPFKLGGTLAKPSLSLDKTKAALSIGKALAGGALFGPAGIAATLVSKTGDKEENPCVAAIEAAKTGVKSEKKEEEKSKDDSQKTLEDVIKDPGSALKNLFGR